MFIEHMIAPMPGDADYDASYFAGGGAYPRRGSRSCSPLAVSCSRSSRGRSSMTNRYCEWTSQPGCRRSLPFRDRPARRGESRRARLPLAPSLPQFLKATSTDAIEKGSDTLGSELLAVTFESAVELPPSMRHEAMEHRWPVATADAYPLVERRARRRRFRSSTGTSRSPRPARYRSPRSSPGIRRSSSRPPPTLSASRTSATTNWRCASPLPTMALGLRLDGISGTRTALPGS